MKNNIIAIDPYIPTEHYIGAMINTYTNIGYTVVPLKMNTLPKSRYIMLNWFENISGRNTLYSLLIFFKKIVKLLIFLILLKKVIWTIHNKQPHRNELQNNFSLFLSKIIMLILLKFSYKVLVHSKITYNYYNVKFHNKFVYVPHPNCINYYGAINENNSLTDSKLKLLFFGNIIEYKNLDILIDAIKELNFSDIELSIVGNISDRYKSIINKKIENYPLITCTFKYIPNEEIPSILSNCHLLVVPFDIESCYNASTIILAFSYMRSVLCTKIGTVIDIDDNNIFFSYNYSNPSEHKQKIIENIVKIRNKYLNKYNDILELGYQCYLNIKNNNDQKVISNSIKTIF